MVVAGDQMTDALLEKNPTKPLLWLWLTAKQALVIHTEEKRMEGWMEEKKEDAGKVWREKSDLGAGKCPGRWREGLGKVKEDSEGEKERSGGEKEGRVEEGGRSWTRA